MLVFIRGVIISGLLVLLGLTSLKADCPEDTHYVFRDPWLKLSETAQEV